MRMSVLQTVREVFRRPPLLNPPPLNPLLPPFDLDLWAGDLQVRLARTSAENQAAQALRYRVFYEEMAATPTARMRARRRDFDDHDDVADHLLVLDHATGSEEPRVVGTYRLIRREAAMRVGGFYTAGEFDISRLEAQPGEILELGRSCVEGSHRGRATLQLLWRGIAAYVTHFDIELMFGCASLPGRDIKQARETLGYLARHHLAPEILRPTALPHLYQPMDDVTMVAKAGLAKAETAKTGDLPPSLPPLIKGYLRVGGWVGDGAVVDHQFGTTDVCVVVRTAAITERYLRHYECATPERRQ